MVVDYNTGNLASIRNAFAKLGRRVKISRSKSDIEQSSAVVLPGVGAFACIKNIEVLRRVILNEIENGKPLLGLCLGLQLLFEESEESPGVRGFGFFKGRVERIARNGFRVPQLGWNSIKIVKKCSLLEGIPNGAYFYFANSYVAPFDEKITVATTEYGREFPSVISKENIFATQFHPEKSGEVGLRLLNNFANLVS
ncbi:MAG: imidazole glycerol phosphate synthase subunit HisH [Candidatus Micrarchaeia archaeon]